LCESYYIQHFYSIFTSFVIKKINYFKKTMTISIFLYRYFIQDDLCKVLNKFCLFTEQLIFCNKTLHKSSGTT